MQSPVHFRPPFNGKRGGTIDTRPYGGTNEANLYSCTIVVVTIDNRSSITI